ncbi:tail fiber domain-containing protein [Pantoea agglomerans]|uniref:tail fiber domain-containing protein n=1 Tax=Enterobacter agglomerans TaxID=549 RepID=UPI003C7D00CF
MSGIFIGNATKIFYNTDAGNNIPNAPTYVNIDELAAFPEVKIQSSINQYDTYNDEYVSVIAANKSIQSVNIVVNYVPDNVTHVFLDSMFTSQTKFQIKISLYESLDALTQNYAILSGYVSSTSNSGDKDSVVKKTYVFTAEDVIARGTAIEMADLKIGDYGVGANGVDIPQFESSTPSGNSFIKVPSTQAQNPTGTDLLGIANVDNGNTTKLVMTESGTFSLYGRNQSSSWTQILTKPQSDSAYVPMNRTVNGKSLSTNITLTPADVSALALTGGTLSGNLNGTTASFSGAVSTGNLTAATIAATSGTFTGAVQADSASITGAITADSLTLQTASIVDLEVTGSTTLSDALTGTTATFTGAVSTGNLTAGTISGTSATFSDVLSGTTGTFTGSVTADSLTLTQPLSVSNGGTGNTTGLSVSATKLQTARNVTINLASTVAGSFDGTANITPGVSGILPIANGGTGNNAGTVGQLTTSRTFSVNLASTSAAGFNGTANCTPGVSGVLALGNGGTGSASPFGTSANTFTQGNDSRLSTVNGKTGGTITTGVSVNGALSTNSTLYVAQPTVDPGFNASTTISIAGIEPQFNVALQYWLLASQYHAFRTVQNGVATFEARSNGWCYAASFNPTSDSNLKFNKQFLDNSLYNTMTTRGMSYSLQGERKSGVIAQDVERFMPDAVTTTKQSVVLEDGTILPETKSLDYSAIAGLHTEALKEVVQLMLEALTDPESAKVKLLNLVEAINEDTSDENKTDLKMEWALLEQPTVPTDNDK